MDDVYQLPKDPHPETFMITDEAFVDAVENDPTVHHKATNAHYSSAWIQGPGAVHLLAEAARDLLAVSALRGEPTTQIAFVRLLALSSAKTLLIWPTDDKDVNGVKVTWKDGTAEFSATNVLRSAKIPVESKKKNRYKVHVVKQSKAGPVLAIDMRFELETKHVPKQRSYSRKKGKKEASPSAQAESTESAGNP